MKEASLTAHVLPPRGLAQCPWQAGKGGRRQTTVPLAPQHGSVFCVAGAGQKGYVICSPGLGALTAAGHRNTGSMGTWGGLQLPHGAAQGPQDAGAGSRPPYGPRGSTRGGTGRLARAVPGVGMGRAGAAPGMPVVDGGPGAGARRGVPTPARGMVTCEAEKQEEGTCGCRHSASPGTTGAQKCLPSQGDSGSGPGMDRHPLKPTPNDHGMEPGSSTSLAAHTQAVHRPEWASPHRSVQLTQRCPAGQVSAALGDCLAQELWACTCQGLAR